MEIYVLNKDLETIGIVDGYKSLIWANRYAQNGDCELYVLASEDALNLLKIGYYLTRNDDDMICRINKIELSTDAENGNYLTVSGIDVKSILDQRIVWNTLSCNGKAETFIRKMLTQNLITSSAERQIKSPNGTVIFQLGAASGFTEHMSEQVSFKNIGEKIRDYCERFKWGYKVTLEDGKFTFYLTKGTDRTDEVIFSDDYENLATTQYVVDETNLGNVTLVAGQGEGSDRVRRTTGSYESLDRYEIYVDAKDIAKEITFEELKAIYPLASEGGHGYIVGQDGSYGYMLDELDILILEDYQVSELREEYPDGVLVEVDGQLYYRLGVTDEVIVADLPSGTPEDTDTVVLRDLVYSVYLITRGYEKTAEYGATTTFEGSVEPNTTFRYKTDYFLGDIVTVENSFGISVGARIVEVVEVEDDNGYSVEPKFEYIQED